jgi:hypothetical protein
MTMKHFGLMLTVLACATTAAAAQSTTALGQFSRWTAYTYLAGGGKVCYAVTQPTESQPKGVNRDPVYVFITNRPKEGVRHEVSVITGYPYKEGSKTEVKIGNDSFVMFTKDDGAWMQNGRGDAPDRLNEGRFGHDRLGNLPPRHRDHGHLLARRCHRGVEEDRRRVPVTA